MSGQYRNDTVREATHARKEPMPDDALVDLQEALDWLERAPCGVEVRIEKQSGQRYHVKRRQPVQ